MQWNHYKITPASRYAGIMHWALWLQNARPQFTVYRYMGNSGTRHFFKQRDGRHVFHKSEKELLQYIRKGWFRPLVYDTARLRSVDFLEG